MALNEEFPDNHRVIFPMARCQFKLGLNEQALANAEKLVNELDYEKAEPFLQKVLQKVDHDEDEDWDGDLDLEDLTESRFRVPWIRLLLLMAICAGMFFGYVPYWLGGGLIGLYFIVKYTIKAFVYRLFTIPFKLKGKALAGATVNVHAVTNISTPKDAADEAKVPQQYYAIDVTIVPPEQSEGFTYWEPGEIALAPMKQRIKTMDDHDHAHQVYDARLHGAPAPQDGGDDEDYDDGGKYAGTQRVLLTVGLPPGGGDYKFVYYFEVFGAVKIPT